MSAPAKPETKGLNQLNRILLQTLMSPNAANIVADRLEELEQENRKELERATYYRDQWQKAQAELAALREENVLLRGALELVTSVPKLTDAQLSELIQNTKVAIDAARKEAAP